MRITKVGTPETTCAAVDLAFSGVPKQRAAIYAQRKAIVEPVNGQIKEARGLRRFLL